MRIARTVVTTLTTVALAGVASLVAIANVEVHPSPTTLHLQAYAAQPATQADPAEDSPKFNCKRHGNRQCGVAVDVTPNNGNSAVQRYVITFNKAGQPVGVKPLGR